MHQPQAYHKHHNAVELPCTACITTPDKPCMLCLSSRKIKLPAMTIIKVTAGDEPTLYSWMLRPDFDAFDKGTAGIPSYVRPFFSERDAKLDFIQHKIEPAVEVTPELVLDHILGSKPSNNR